MDATLAASLESGLTTFSSDAATQLAAVLPIALGLLVSIAVVFFGIKMFRAIVHI